MTVCRGLSVVLLASSHALLFSAPPFRASVVDSAAEQVQRPFPRRSGRSVSVPPATLMSNSQQESTVHFSARAENELWEPRVFGCTDQRATNYQPDADADDGSCYLDTAAELVGGSTVSNPASAGKYTYSDQQRMSPEDAMTMYSLGQLVGEMLDKYGIQWWVTDGSLLGAVRNKGIIPHDDDMDYNVLDAQLDVIKSRAFRKELKTNGLYLTAAFGLVDRLYIWNWTEFNRSHGLQNERGTRMKLDLWPLVNSGGSLHQVSSVQHAFPADLCERKRKPGTTGAAETYTWDCMLQKWSFGSGYVWAPSRRVSEWYLVRRYGRWKDESLCQGTLHSCQLIANRTHDMKGRAEPFEPLPHILFDVNAARVVDDDSRTKGQREGLENAQNHARSREQIEEQIEEQKQIEAFEEDEEEELLKTYARTHGKHVPVSGSHIK